VLREGEALLVVVQVEVGRGAVGRDDGCGVSLDCGSTVRLTGKGAEGDGHEDAEGDSEMPEACVSPAR
jgi:hypothetical protein